MTKFLIALLAVGCCLVATSQVQAQSAAYTSFMNAGQLYYSKKNYPLAITSFQSAIQAGSTNAALVRNAQNHLYTATLTYCHMLFTTGTTALTSCNLPVANACFLNAYTIASTTHAGGSTPVLSTTAAGTTLISSCQIFSQGTTAIANGFQSYSNGGNISAVNGVLAPIGVTLSSNSSKITYSNATYHPFYPHAQNALKLLQNAVGSSNPASDFVKDFTTAVTYMQKGDYAGAQLYFQRAAAAATTGANTANATIAANYSTSVAGNLFTALADLNQATPNISDAVTQYTNVQTFLTNPNNLPPAQTRVTQAHLLQALIPVQKAFTTTLTYQVAVGTSALGNRTVATNTAAATTAYNNVVLLIGPGPYKVGSISSPGVISPTAAAITFVKNYLGNSPPVNFVTAVTATNPLYTFTAATTATIAPSNIGLTITSTATTAASLNIAQGTTFSFTTNGATQNLVVLASVTVSVPASGTSANQVITTATLDPTLGTPTAANQLSLSNPSNAPPASFLQILQSNRATGRVSQFAVWIFANPNGNVANLTIPSVGPPIASEIAALNAIFAAYQQANSSYTIPPVLTTLAGG